MPAVGIGLGLMAGDRGGSKVNVSDINAKYRSETPHGYLLRGDLDEAERMRTRGAASFGSLYGDARAGAIRRAATRGTLGSPALESNLSTITEGEGRRLFDVGQSADSYLHGVMANREGFDRERLFKAWDTDVAARFRNHQADESRHSSFWNSLGELSRGIGTLGPRGASTAGGGGGISLQDLGWNDSDLGMGPP